MFPICDALRDLYNLYKLILATLLKVTLFHGCFSRFLNCTNATKSRKASHIIPESVDIEINKLKKNLIEIDGINTLLREENQKLREENAIIKKSNNVNKANNTNKINKLETQVKSLQKSLTEANTKNAEKTQKYINYSDKRDYIMCQNRTK